MSARGLACVSWRATSMHTGSLAEVRKGSDSVWGVPLRRNGTPQTESDPLRTSARDPVCMLVARHDTHARPLADIRDDDAKVVLPTGDAVRRLSYTVRRAPRIRRKRNSSTTAPMKATKIVPGSPPHGEPTPSA